MSFHHFRNFRKGGGGGGNSSSELLFLHPKSKKKVLVLSVCENYSITPQWRNSPQAPARSSFPAC